MGNIAEVNHHKLFNWAAEMSEIGLTISHSAYQKHGAYILENSDLSGFSKSEQKFMADLVRLHRGSYTKFAKKMRNDPLFIKNEYFCMLVAFRLSIIFNRSRSGYDHRKVITIKPNRYRSITISCDQEWLKQNKLTKYSLEEEINELRDVIGFTIDYQTI